ncbi:WD repeat-containing protein 20 [Patella vulgata]|uniref:WD repeat-containing protein 20 n=1 Tax=Patella vulgata TaxID=6465 RepID=UPI0021808C6B|nr:WD repeat-containing protein 20 [Patella vulgata]
MAAPSEGGSKDELKTHFGTREGTYKLMPLSEYSKPSRVAYNGQTNTPVKVSFVKSNDGNGSATDRICFNVGRELYVYVYKGVKKAVDLTKPIDKRIYKGTLPTCHDFNQHYVTSDSVLLLVGFTAGQVQLIDPIKKEISKLYNEERMIDKTKVTCIKWIPQSPNQFLVSHASGQMYVYNEELPCGLAAPHYQPFKSGEGFSIYTCKTKSTRNPLYRWIVGQGAIHEFAFSPCSVYLAIVSQDGYLRVYNYNSMEVIGTMKSYFGGLLCVSWSPDGRFIVTGGEDDLVTVWSFHERRVVCRGQGHKSWVNVVSFDFYTSCVCDDMGCDFNGSEEDYHSSRHCHTKESVQKNGSDSNRNSLDGNGLNITSYRFGSIGQDTMLCLWDLTEDIIKQSAGRSRTSISTLSNSASCLPRCNSLPNSQKRNSIGNDVSAHAEGNSNANTHQIQNAVMNATNKFATLSVADRKESQEKKEHKRNFSLASRNTDKVNMLKSNHVKPVDDSIKLLGTMSCPRLDEVPILEPLVYKKIAQERLTSLVFREECLVTACQEGLVYTWARPGKGVHEG